jgi:DNA-binding Lrp family transcriptional regulator
MGRSRFIEKKLTSSSLEQKRIRKLLIHSKLINSRGVNMPTAFVLINTEIGSESDVLKDLKKVEGVEEASAVYGVYDIVARVKADTMDKLKEIVTWRIRRLDKVRSTLTMIVVEER